MFPFVSMNESFRALTMGRAVIFCQCLEDCPKIYRFFQTALGLMFTYSYPAGSPDICDNRLVHMFHSYTESCVKEKIIKVFTSDLSPLRVVITTTAFGIGIDVSKVRTIIYFGSCEDVETCIRIQAVSLAGRDGRPSKTVILSRKGIKQHINKQMN